MPEKVNAPAAATVVGTAGRLQLLQSPMRDRDVREAVRRKLFSQYGTDSHSRIVEEMGVWSGSVRIDLAVINGELHGIELKSDRDTLERLPFQAQLYSRVFDRVELVVGAKHSEKAAKLVPDWWAVSVATLRDGAVHIRPMIGHPGSRNPIPDPYLVAQLLWKDEALAVLENYGIAKGFRSKNVRVVHERLASLLSFEDLSREVRETLKRRPSDWLGQ
ncbi:MAG TPA: sce7726 family protein [Rhizomicrobium sp.]|nr:sce7726 family protein [Rhizomicrobium sp.]